MTRGADIWLNNPRRPLEASGTSGMKAAMNGAPNVSILDGWWPEGCEHGVTGWWIGEADPKDDAFDDKAAAKIDKRDRDLLHHVLTHEVLPAFADRKEVDLDHAREHRDVAVAVLERSDDRGLHREGVHGPLA